MPTLVNNQKMDEDKLNDLIRPNISDRFIEDGSYLRLKNIQLGYSVPVSILDRIKVRKLRVYVSAQNLFTITDYSGLDPEIGAFNALEIGIDRGFYPQARTFLGGLSLTF